MFRSVSDINSG